MSAGGPGAAHRGRATIHASPEQIWAVINDADALSRVLPGVESLAADGPGRFSGVLATRTSFMTVRADMTAALLDAEPPRSVRLEIAGRARGIGGAFVVSVPMRFEPTDDGPPPATRLDYELEITLSGALASLGASMMRRSIEGLVTELIANLETEVSNTAE